MNEELFAITRIVRDRGPLARAEIARLLKMSPSTVGRVVETMLDAGLLREIGARIARSAGRPSIQLQFNAKIATVISVDLRLTTAYGVATDLCGTVLASRTLPLNLETTGQALSDLNALIRSLIDGAAGLPPVRAIVIGAPSIVDHTSGVIEWAPSLGWENLPLKALLESEFGIPTRVENDVNLAALGEFCKGAGRKVNQNMVFVSVGAGIGAGIILDGRLYRGATHAAGEVAYFLTDVHVLRDQAGQFGNLDHRVGHDGLIRMAQIIAQRYPASDLARLISVEGARVRTRDILALAGSGDQAALVVFNELVDILTLVICNISVVLDPEMVVLGGPSNWPWPQLIAAIQKRVGDALLRPIQLAPTELGNDALVVGGAYAALDWINLP